MQSGNMRIGDRLIGRGQPCFIVAEAGVNHNGDPGLALQLIKAAKDSGADAVKFQAFKSGALVTARARKARYQVETTGQEGSQQEMLRSLELGAADFARLKVAAEEMGLVFLCTPFDSNSLEELLRLGVHALKVGSGDLTNTPLLRQIRCGGKPVILSTGMATISEVEAAVDTLTEPDGTSPVPVALLHCVSNYPAAPESCNLRAMATLSNAFGLPVGFSDHTLGIEVALAAVALGAQVLEKHMTLDNNLAGPDHRASLEPPGFTALVRQVRNVEAAMGDGRKRPSPSERDVAAVARRSLVAVRPLAAGERIHTDLLAAKRPAGGVEPRFLDLVVGKRLRRPLEADEVLTWEHVMVGE